MRRLASRHFCESCCCFTATLLIVSWATRSAHANTAQPDQVQDLKRLSIEELMEIDVTSVSRRPERIVGTPAAVSVITAEDIRRAGVSTLPDALRLADGVMVGRFNGGAWGISVRGFTSTANNKLLVLIDGRSVYTQLFGGVFWETVDYVLADIERIEVIRGPAGTLWGPNAINGVINRYVFQRFVADNLSATAEVVADSLQAAVAFGDRDAANETLTSLASKPELDLGCAYDQQGQLLAQYSVMASLRCPLTAPAEGMFTENDTLVVSQNVRQEGRDIGRLYLRRSLSDVRTQSSQQAIALAFISGLSLIIGLILSSRLQRLISDPIAKLAQMARGVSERHDYSLRATSETGGEIETLIDAFNQMLEQIQTRTTELQKSIQARDDFLSVAAHELRNPVNAVQLHLVGILRAAQRSAQPLTHDWVSERVGQANSQIDRLVRLLDNLLDASRIAEQGIQLELEDVDFAEIVHSVVERFEEDPKNRHVVVRASHVVGRWDRLRLEQIATNLLSNAFKYGSGKPIVISSQPTTKPRASL